MDAKALWAIAACFYLVPPSYAQQQMCAPLEKLVTDLGQKFKERIVWEGVVKSPQGPIETMLFQSEEGTWTFATVQGATACVMAAGTDATPPINLGKGV